GDMHGLNTLEHQPQKVAAMEGNWQTRGHAPLLLFAWPDQEIRDNRFEIGIPSGASLILKHDPAGVVPGLDDFVAADGTPLHPPVAPVFWSFRIMVGVGLLMLALSWASVWFLWRRGAGGLPRFLLYGLVAMTFSGWLATLTGWYTTEIGRQPWLVQDVLTTARAVADVPTPMVASTLAAYLIVYALLIAAYIGVLFYLARKASQDSDAPPITRPGAIAATPAE
ncbi:MAG: cytochrome ubiquinol oxidase subunit I, partial [Rhodospirillales bacterium]|nr:cytochrome ubiquinol oxidase subunit I [Rhodospirillales bacterium]